MKTDYITERASDTILYTYLLCACCAAASYFMFKGIYFEAVLQIVILIFLFTCTLIAIKTASVDGFYLPPVEIPMSNKRWERCIEWWNNLPEDELTTNIHKLKTMNRKNADALLRAFEQLELFEKCSIIKRAIS
ncbi:hypothetical protein [Emticicia fontis]